jgi:predicted O-methyltransferase YrrM
VREEGFAETFAGIGEIGGWLSEDQARRLWACAERLGPEALVVEIGSFHGRSTIVLARAAPADATIVAIDPYLGSDRGPNEIRAVQARGDADAAAFAANVEAAGVAGRIEQVRLPSARALPRVSRPIDLLYVDGAHRYRPALADIREWGDRVAPGGTLAIHDAFSSLGVTLALGRALFFGGRFAYVGRTRSLAEYRRADLPGRERIANAWRQARELPWFARNLMVKVLLVLRRDGLARRVGDGSGEWPY